MKSLFYIQDTRSYVGNSILWWKCDNNGYVCDVREARIFTEDEAKKICNRQALLRMWPKNYIDERIRYHIDMQDCNYEQAIKEIS